MKRSITSTNTPITTSDEPTQTVFIIPNTTTPLPPIPSAIAGSGGSNNVELVVGSLLGVQCDWTNSIWCYKCIQHYRRSHSPMLELDDNIKYGSEYSDEELNTTYDIPLNRISVGSLGSSTGSSRRLSESR